MIAFYAMGGGLGHMRRARAVLSQLFENETHLIVTASRYASGDDVLRVPRHLAASRGAFADWLRAELRALRPSALIVDAFPLGILGELADHSVLPDVPLYHVARLLRWEAYAAAFPGTPRPYAASFAVEPLTPAHQAFLAAHSGRVERIELSVPENVPVDGNPLADYRVPGRPLALVVHSGPAAEVHALISVVPEEDARIVVASPLRDLDLPSRIARIQTMLPASSLFPFADRIVTACGFNSMRETAPYASRHSFRPFARRFDRQDLRAARRYRALRALA
jgi:hypothetical protein